MSQNLSSWALLKMLLCKKHYLWCFYSSIWWQLWETCSLCLQLSPVSLYAHQYTSSLPVFHSWMLFIAIPSHPSWLQTYSMTACMVQLFIEHLFGGTEVFFLMAIAYDHYVAICKPLHYLTIMNWRVCILLLVVACTGGFAHSFLQILFVYSLPFCAPNVIDHFMCDMYPILGLACTDTFHWCHCGCQWWSELHSSLYPSPSLLWNNSKLPQHSFIVKREVQSPVYLQLPQ